MAQVVLGINNAFAAKHWPQAAEWARIVVDRLGLKSVQFSFDLIDPAWPAEIATALASQVRAAALARDLDIRTTFSGGIAYARPLLAHPDPAARRWAMDWYRSAMHLTAVLGAEATGGHMGTISAVEWDDPERRNAIRATLIKSVRSLSGTAWEQGLKHLLWELMPSPSEIPHTPEEAVEVLREVNEGAAVPVRLAFDLGHCCAYDLPKRGEPHEWLQRLLPWTPMVHLQQTDGRGDRHWPFSGEHEAAGIIYPRRIVEIARSSPLPRVDLVLEVVHPPEAAPERIVDDLARSVEVWAKHL
jgi:sugar phosphate isomerase/epimerase